MLRWIAQQVIHHHAVGHGGIDRPQPVFAIQPFGGPRPAFLDRARARALGPGHDFQHTVQRREEGRPAGALMRRARAGREHTRHEQLINVDSARIFCQRLARAQHKQRHDHRPRPIAHLGKMHRKPARQQDQFRWHGRDVRPAGLAIQRQKYAGEDVRLDGAAALPDLFPRARHVRRIDIVADHLEREIGLYRGGDIEGAVVIQRPAAMAPWMRRR